MSNNINNNNYSKTYNIYDYTDSDYGSFNYNNDLNKVHLNLDIHARYAPILNVKHIKEVHDQIQQYVEVYKANIERLRQLEINMEAVPPFMNRGINVSLRKMQELMTHLDAFERDINELDYANKKLVSEAWTARYKNIDKQIQVINNLIAQEERDKSHNREMAMRTSQMGDYFADELIKKGYKF